MKRFLIAVFALTGLAAPAQTTGLLMRIAFGSGLDTDRPQPIWSAVASNRPDLFVYLGDRLGSNAVAATNCEVRWTQAEGFGSRIIGSPGRLIQIIWLNTLAVHNPTSPTPLLDAEQWTWFREQLRKPAQFRIVASGIPVLSEDHQGEKWVDWPRDNRLLYDMITDTEADGIVFVSGGRHKAELSMLGDKTPYPLYDLTTSPMNTMANEPVEEINRRGISDVVRDNNFGLVTIDWSTPDPAISLEIRDERGAARIQHTVPLSALQLISYDPQDVRFR